MLEGIWYSLVSRVASLWGYFLYRHIYTAKCGNCWLLKLQMTLICFDTCNLMKSAAAAVDSPAQFITLSWMAWEKITGNCSHETLITAVKVRIWGKPVCTGNLLFNHLPSGKANVLFFSACKCKARSWQGDGDRRVYTNDLGCCAHWCQLVADLMGRTECCEHFW